MNSDKRKTNATLHENASEKMKTSAALHGNASRPDWSPKMGPPKTLQTIYFNMFLNIFGVPLEHPLCAHQKMDHPKWTPKSSPGDRTKHSFSIFFVNFVLRDRLGGRSRRALHFENMQKALLLQILLTPSLSPCWTFQRNTPNQKTSAALHGNAPAQNGTSATLHGNQPF